MITVTFDLWLNLVDARSSYDWRRETGLAAWRRFFDKGLSPDAAIAVMRSIRGGW